MEYVICLLCSNKECTTREEHCPRWRTIYQLALEDMKNNVKELHRIMDDLKEQEAEGYGI